MALEREIADKWCREWIAAHPKDYWLRISDSADGIKPFDGVLFMDMGGMDDHLALAIEFKVWRLKRKKFDYSTVEPHQMRELLRFRDGKGRTSVILVYYEHEKRWARFQPSAKKLRERIAARRKVPINQVPPQEVP